MYRREEIAVDGHSMPVLVFEPEGSGPHPGLVIAQHLPVAHAGLELDPFQLETGRRYARAGYLCVMPFLFHRWPAEAPMELKRTQFRDDWTVSDLDGAMQVLVGQSGLDTAQVGIVGHCWGGRIAWLGAASDARYRACAIFYGGRVKMPFADNATAPIDLVAHMRCSVLGVFGNDDESPSPKDVDDYESALRQAGIEHEFHRYDGAGHGFQDFTNADRYRETHSEDAWRNAIEFFGRHLKTA